MSNLVQEDDDDREITELKEKAIRTDFKSQVARETSRLDPIVPIRNSSKKVQKDFINDPVDVLLVQSPAGECVTCDSAV